MKSCLRTCSLISLWLTQGIRNCSAYGSIFLVLISTIVQCEEMGVSHIPRKLRYPYNSQWYIAHQNNYRFRDFLWMGSGDDALPQESEDGLAWEDDFHNTGMYPVGMTPVVVTSMRVSPTLSFGPEATFSPTYALDPSNINPSSTLSSQMFIEPTMTISTPTTNWGLPENSDRLSAAASDLKYWIKTIIKHKNNSSDPNDLVFQEDMQQKLASVYAKAFKRQLMKSLGVTNKQTNNMFSNHSSNELSNRFRRSSTATRLYYQHLNLSDFSEHRPVFSKTAMNVSVSMINVSYSVEDKSVDMKYVVFAEDAPVLGFLAVKELKAVTTPEMERQLGYEIVEKASPLIQPQEQSQIGVSSSTPWIIGLFTVVFLMLVILLMILFLAFKWRHNRLRNPRNEISHNRGTRVSIDTEGDNNVQNNNEDIQHARPSGAFQYGGEEVERTQYSKRTPERDKTASTEDSQQNTVSDDTGSQTLLSRASPPNTYRFQSPKKTHIPGMSRKTIQRRRSRKKRPRRGAEDKSPQKYLKEKLKQSSPQDFRMAGDLSKNMDKISFGNLDVHQDSEARPISARARKIISSRPTTHYQAEQGTCSSGQVCSQTTSGQHESNENSQGNLGDSDLENIDELDRELSERSFEDEDSCEIDHRKKDAEVQTPRRYTRRSPRLKTSPKHRATHSHSKFHLLPDSDDNLCGFNSESTEMNPLGKMRRRFHQFLDDAFNVMAAGKRDTSGKTPHSAKVTLSHQIKTKAPGRPWTSQVIREESLRRIRPKSSVVLGPPKPAWTASSPRRCQSARSKSIQPGSQDAKTPEPIAHSSDKVEKIFKSHPSKANVSSKFKAFEPSHSEVQICLANDPNRTVIPGSSHSTRSSLHPRDPAVPLMEAIRDEMKRFDKVKVQTVKSSDNVNEAIKCD